MHRKRNFYRLLLRSYLPLLVLVMVVLGLLYFQETTALDSLLEKDDFRRVELAASIERNRLQPLGVNALFLAGHPDMCNWLNNRSEANKEKLATIFAWFMEKYPAYDQVRFLNAEGMEEIRIDQVQGQPRVVPQERLQDKSKRYYTRVVNALDADAIYVSPLDLNMERGQVELPPKPMLRVGTPVFDAAGQRQGSILLNYMGSQLLDELKRLKPDDSREIWLLNKNGYWLLGSKPEQEWGFVLPEASQQKMSVRFPKVWKHMQHNSDFGRVSEQQSYFTYRRIDASSLVNNGVSDPAVRWYVVIYTPESYLNKKFLPIRLNYGVLFILIAGLLLLVCSRLANKEMLQAEADQLVREQERQYRELLEGAPDSIVIVDQNGIIRIMNVEAEHTSGYSREELIGKPVEMLLPPRLQEQHVGYRQSYLSNPVVRPMGASKELFLLRKDGSEMPVEISLSPLFREEEHLVTAIIRDITQRKQQMQHIKQLNRDLLLRSDELKAINSELESFSYSVSHDLRAPLRAVDGFSRTVIKDYADKLDDRGKDRLQRIRKAAQNMATLIDDLLDLSRISRADVVRETVDVSKLVTDIVAQLREGEPQREVEVQIEPDLTAYADARLLKVMLTNLISNAWKFTGKVASARIWIEAKQSDGNTVFSVRDNGAGFNMEYAEKLFGAFQRLHDAGEFAGTGIGLATVMRVINKHGGRIWAESAVDQGATFYFTLGKE